MKCSAADAVGPASALATSERALAAVAGLAEMAPFELPADTAPVFLRARGAGLGPDAGAITPAEEEDRAPGEEGGDGGPSGGPDGEDVMTWRQSSHRAL